jgi:hypothetical protein
MKCADIANIDYVELTQGYNIKGAVEDSFCASTLDDEDSSVPGIQIVGQATPRIGIQNDGR